MSTASNSFAKVAGDCRVRRGGYVTNIVSRHWWRRLSFGGVWSPLELANIPLVENQRVPSRMSSEFSIKGRGVAAMVVTSISLR